MTPSTKERSPPPPEIWMHIAKFVPHKDLCSMYSINHAFFELSMDARYRAFVLKANSNAGALRRTMHRVSDPSIAPRVRCLVVNLREYPEIFDEGPGILRPVVIDVMAKTVACLTNVVDFSLQWFPPPHGKQVIPLLTAACKSFGSRLRKLSLHVPLTDLAMFLPTVDGLVSLRDLDLELRDQEVIDMEEDMLSTALAPFVNKVGSNLHSLSFSSFMNNIDVAPFFNHLDKFPKLERVQCLIGNEGDMLVEPSGTLGFLCKHATTLRHLEWAWKNRRSDKVVVDFLSGDTSNLYTLRIQIPQCAGGFAMIVQRIKYSVHTLTSVGFFGYEMTYEEVKIVISLFVPRRGGNLKELSIGVKYLSPELILLLMQNLPCLEKLTISMIKLTGREAGHGTPEALLAHRFAHSEQEEFAATMRTYDFRGWTLRDIYIEAVMWDNQLSKQLMWLLAECIPSIQTFGGKDKELCKIDTSDVGVLESIFSQI